MRLGNALFLLRQHWRFHWASWAVVALLVCVSASVLTLIAGADHALRRALRDWSQDFFPPTVLVIRPVTPELGKLSYLAAAAMSLSHAPKISAEALEQIGAMPEVRRLYPVTAPTFSMKAIATFMGDGMETDVVVMGVDRELIAADLGPDTEFEPVNWRAGEMIPVVISTYFIDLFNTLYAPSSNLPPLSARTALGFDFTIELGSSVLGGPMSMGERTRAHCVVVGLTRNPELLAVTIPRETAEDMQRWHTEETGRDVPPQHPQAFVEVNSMEDIPALEARLAPLDLRALSPSHMDRVSTLERLLTLTAGSLQMVILALTLLGCFCLMALQMEHRRSSLVFLHVSGVPRSTIYALLTGEAGAVVFGAAVIGAGGSITILNWGLSALAAQLPVSLPPPHLGVVLSAGLAALCVVILAGTVTGVALGVVAHRLRGVGNRPVG